MAYLTYWAISKSHLHAFWAQPGKGGFPTFGQAVDLVIGSVVSWTPLAADYTRFSRTRRGAALGARHRLLRADGLVHRARRS